LKEYRFLYFAGRWRKLQQQQAGFSLPFLQGLRGLKEGQITNNEYFGYAQYKYRSKKLNITFEFNETITPPTSLAHSATHSNGGLQVLE
jgi:hypothetical protein